MKYVLSVLFILLISQTVLSQHDDTIQWKTWTALEKAIAQEPKPVFIYFNAEWCVYCKKLERDVFTKKEVIKTLNKNYYAVEMNVESLDTIVFDGVTFINKQAETKRNGIHELPLLLASQENEPFTLPATLILNRNFAIEQKIYNYYTSKQLLEMLN
ncbi:thioredoxin family protein [Winogradskyella psychrotolerans]|uniref:thioredoxin family protein n=1 Tax=Winogradskyella psychrotolerans TaxID=1344585 RepID=UPI001C078F55|nr:thioredoxin family protein [Winogradskyella psychrotolerans]MBU2926888.1 thioredoxin family protein [Winogradskyella psychrotolerans]